VSDQPDYLEGEVEILDALIDLYPVPAPEWSDDEWELRMYRAVVRAYMFYDNTRGKVGYDNWSVLEDILNRWLAARLSRVTMHQAFGNSARYLKRYYERFPHLQGGC